MVAGPDVLLDFAGPDPAGHLPGRQHVVETPADIPSLHVPPRRPPRKQPVIVGRHGAADVNEPSRDNPLEQRPLLGELADRPRLALFRVYITVGPRDVQIATDRDRAA